MDCFNAMARERGRAYQTLYEKERKVAKLVRVYVLRISFCFLYIKPTIGEMTKVSCYIEKVCLSIRQHFTVQINALVQPRLRELAGIDVTHISRLTQRQQNDFLFLFLYSRRVSLGDCLTVLNLC